MSEGSCLLAAYSYTKGEYSVVPVPTKSKGPSLPGWQRLRLTEHDLVGHFNRPTNIGLLLGEPSGGLVDVDLDCEEAVELTKEFLPSTDAKTGRPSRPGSHWWYRAPGAVTKQFRDPVTNEMILELRSTGGQTLVGPSVHPSGERYDVLEGSPREVPHNELLDCAFELARAVVELRYGSAVAATYGEPKAAAAPSVSLVGIVVSDDLKQRRAAAYLDKMEASISGQGGHDRCYAAMTAMAHGFELEPCVAMDLLKSRFNPRCQPPWSDKELEHKLDDALNRPHERPRGWLLRADKPTPYQGVVVPANEASQPKDPGPLPEDLLYVPGFINDVMNLTMHCAPHPNRVLALTGALALQAFLVGRAVRDESDMRPNVYLLALAHSAGGKDMPRKVNAAVLRDAGLQSCLAQQIASAEGLEDALAATPSMLLQTDEFDSILQSIRTCQDGRYEKQMAAMLTIYSSSGSVYARRRKAGVGDPGVIDQPNLVLLGTAIPTHFYGALSDKMLTNGLFSRMLVFDSGKRGKSQTAKPIEIPPHVRDTARWWSEQQRRGGFDGEVDPRTVYATPEAAERLRAFQCEMDTRYDEAAERDDAVGAAVWGRASESARKLALLYAVSDCHRDPKITEAAVRWGTGVARHQVERMLFMVSEHTADSPFEREVNKVKRHLRGASNHELDRTDLLRKMRCKSAQFEEVLGTMQERGEVVCSTRGTSGRSATVYSLVVQEGETRGKEGGGSTALTGA